MRQMLIGLVLGGLLMIPWPVAAYRMARPPEFHEWTPNSFTQLNDTLLQLWNISNGLLQLNISTSDPDGSRRGNKGELVLYDPGASEELCVNVDGSSDWDCTALTP